MRNFKVVTMATQEGGYLKELLASCQRHSIEPIILGWGKEWTCHMMKLRLLADHFRRTSYQPRDVVVWVDAFDCIFQHGQEDILQAFDHYGKPMLFSSEQGKGWPFPADLFPEGKHEYRGICAGVWMAEVWAIRQMLDLFDPHHLPDELPGDDQGLLQAYTFIKPGLCAIDTECKLALTLDLEPTKNPIVWNKWGDCFVHEKTNTSPCILHGAAGYNMEKELEPLGYR